MRSSRRLLVSALALLILTWAVAGCADPQLNGTSPLDSQTPPTTPARVAVSTTAILAWPTLPGVSNTETPTTVPPPTTSLLAVAGTQQGATTTTPAEPVYALVGDSITSLQPHIYERRLGRCGSWHIDAQFGRRTVGDASGLSAATRLAEHNPDHWIINLGTNDAGEPGRLDANTARKRVEDLLEIIGNRPSTWVTVVSPEHPDDADTWNHTLEQLELPTIDWAQHTNPEFRWDGVHVTEAGAEQLAELYCVAANTP